MRMTLISGEVRNGLTHPDAATAHLDDILFQPEALVHDPCAAPHHVPPLPVDLPHARAVRAASGGVHGRQEIAGP